MYRTIWIVWAKSRGAWQKVLTTPRRERAERLAERNPGYVVRREVEGPPA